MPPTPPSSLSSDDLEDNQSAELHTIPSSPSSSSSLSSYSPNTTQIQTTQQIPITSKHNSSQNLNANASTSARGYNGSSSRQPIHTPLISNQPVCIALIK